MENESRIVRFSEPRLNSPKRTDIIAVDFMEIQAIRFVASFTYSFFPLSHLSFRDIKEKKKSIDACKCERLIFPIFRLSHLLRAYRI